MRRIIFQLIFAPGLISFGNFIGFAARVKQKQTVEFIILNFHISDLNGMEFILKITARFCMVQIRQQRQVFACFLYG